MPLDRAAARNQPRTPAGRPVGNPWPNLSPRRAQIAQHLLLAGPFLGALAAIYRYLLSTHSPAHPDAVSGQVVRYMQLWHGHYFGSFYVTPFQDVALQAMAGAGLLWMVAIIALLVRLGVKTR